MYKIANPFDKLSYAQHYNIPTRLLDWSESIFTAMYFAVTSGGKEYKEKCGKLYILNTYSLNQLSGIDEGKGNIHTSTDFGTLFRAEMAYSFSAKGWARRLKNNYKEFDWDIPPETRKYQDHQIKSGKHYSVFIDPIAVLPVLTHQRMLVQSSAFTLHGGSYCWSKQHEPREFPKTHKKLKIYHEITIPASKKDHLKSDLFKFGIHRGTLFPEIDQQRDFLKSVFRRT